MIKQNNFDKRKKKILFLQFLYNSANISKWLITGYEFKIYPVSRFEKKKLQIFPPDSHIPSEFRWALPSLSRPSHWVASVCCSPPRRSLNNFKSMNQKIFFSVFWFVSFRNCQARSQLSTPSQVSIVRDEFESRPKILFQAKLKQN